MYHAPPNHPIPGQHQVQQQPPPPAALSQHERQVQEQLRHSRMLQSQQFHRQENNDSLIKFSRDIKKMKTVLEELMTISCEALKENAGIDNCYNNGSSQVQDSMNDGIKQEPDTSLKNSTIKFGKKLEHYTESKKRFGLF